MWCEASAGERCHEDAFQDTHRLVVMETVVGGTSSENRGPVASHPLVRASCQDSAQTAPPPGAPHCPSGKQAAPSLLLPHPHQPPGEEQGKGPWPSHLQTLWLSLVLRPPPALSWHQLSEGRNRLMNGFVSCLPVSQELCRAVTPLLPVSPLPEPPLILHLATSWSSFRSTFSSHFLLKALPDYPMAGPALSTLYSPINALVPETCNGLVNVLPLLARLGLEFPSVHGTRTLVSTLCS